MGSQTQETSTEDFIIVFVALAVFVIFLIALFLVLACCRKERCNKKNKKIKVLCTAGDEDFKTAFEFFIANNLNQKLKWINNKTEFTPKGKYVLLCDLKNRLPGDIQRVLLELDITKEEEKEADILVVVMRKDSGGRGTKFNFIGTEDHPLHHLPLTNIFYHLSFPISGEVNDKAAEDIKTFSR